MPVATVLTYTENEQKAIEILKANAGNPLSAKDLGIAVAVLTSLIRKSEKFPGEAIVVHKEDYNAVCPTCGVFTFSRDTACFFAPTLHRTPINY